MPVKAITAAADTSGTAVALAEQSAAKVSFQRPAPSFPPAQNDDSAISPVPAAAQFSGNIAQNAKFAVTTATNESNDR